MRIFAFRQRIPADLRNFMTVVAMHSSVERPGIAVRFDHDRTGIHFQCTEPTQYPYHGRNICSGNTCYLVRNAVFRLTDIGLRSDTRNLDGISIGQRIFQSIIRTGKRRTVIYLFRTACYDLQLSFRYLHGKDPVVFSDLIIRSNVAPVFQNAHSFDRIFALPDLRLRPGIQNIRLLSVHQSRKQTFSGNDLACVLCQRRTVIHFFGGGCYYADGTGQNFNDAFRTGNRIIESYIPIDFKNADGILHYDICNFADVRSGSLRF